MPPAVGTPDIRTSMRDAHQYHPVLYPTHLVAGYLLGLHRSFSVLAVVAGAAVPDLIDKPLGLVLTAQFHTVAHSALAAAVVGVPAAVLAVRGRTWLTVRGRTWLAFALGWNSHLALDALHMVLNSRPADTQFLLWPVVEHEPQLALSPVEFFMFYIGTLSSVVELGIWLAALAVVVRRMRRTDDGPVGTR